jgi:AcrR family transcriptional regulator
MAGSKPARVLAREGRVKAPGAYDGAIRSQLEELQRARMVRAVFDVAAQRGASNMSVAHVVERAGVSRRTFYELFDDGEDCFLAAFEQAYSYASERVLGAYEAETGWRERIRAALVALLCFLEEEPTIGRLLIAESFGGGAVPSAWREDVIAKLTGAIERGREEGKACVSPSLLTGEGLLGGALTVIHSRLAQKVGEPLVELTNPLMSMIVLPYLGLAAARSELARPTPVSPGKPRVDPLLSDPFKDAGIRLTYRTVRVLVAIADHPDASNRLVAETAQINDQGQISKLLTRLERAGLIGNAGIGPGKGAPNAWTLTTNGYRVLSTIGTQTRPGRARAITPSSRILTPRPKRAQDLMPNRQVSVQRSTSFKAESPDSTVSVLRKAKRERRAK